MISGKAEPGDALRYRAGPRKPVLVLNVTRACNLRCLHCYARATARPADDELSEAEILALVRDAAGFGCPVLLLSGGEPLMRGDIFRIAAGAVDVGMRVAVSTNGTLIDDTCARELARAGVAYVGVSLDGVGETHDRFRGAPGAFERALAGIERAREAGLRAGVRFTITRSTAGEAERVMDLVEERSVERLCFYHLVPSGRGSRLLAEALARDESRAVVRGIFDRARSDAGAREILTVDNHSDGPCLSISTFASAIHGARSRFWRCWRPTGATGPARPLPASTGAAT